MPRAATTIAGQHDQQRRSLKLPVASRMAAAITRASRRRPPAGAQLGSVPPPTEAAEAERCRVGRRVSRCRSRRPSYWTFWRAMIARAIMLTTRVIANRTRPEAIRALTSTPEDSGNLSAMLAAIVDGFAWLIRLKVTTPGDREDDRHRHRLAERAAEAEHRAADDRRLAERQDRHPDHLPAGRAERERALLQAAAASARRPRGRPRRRSAGSSRRARGRRRASCGR